MPTTCRSEKRSRPSRPIDIDRLREVLDYDAKTGLFRWRQRLSDKIKIGDIAGCISTQQDRSYLVIRFDGRLNLAHRLAWAHHYGKQPPIGIDHDDGNGLHNWIDNLRSANQSQNSANMRKTIKSRTGLRGVYPYGTTGLLFEAKAMKDYKIVHFGVFDTAQSAYEAYCAGMQSLFGEFASLV